MKYAYIILNGDENFQEFANSVMIENESSLSLEEDTTNLILFFEDTSLMVTEKLLSLLMARDNSSLGYIAAISPSSKALREVEKLLYDKCCLALSYASKPVKPEKIKEDIMKEEIKLPHYNIITRLLDR
ncbi:MAG: hypothetical protein K6G51_08335 [Sphaerochaetaceae bacterium]|nr:hypothetical protein [Sphaerochaetaceae bacterium]